VIQIIDGHLAELTPVARSLFLEYAESLGFDLCFQGFEKELAELPGGYAPPSGRLLLAQDESGFAGCVAFRRIGPQVEKTCEMKRLYVRPAYRGRGVGRLLVDRLLAEARAAGHARMYLDTLESMTAAIALYQSFGFKECPPYSYHPIAGTRCFDLNLA
jgi:ribosomal protein S18 acetylase RimI-like enzyme